jgi:hypothetical protein
MTAMTARLEPIEYTWQESASPVMREQGRSVLVPVAARRRRPEAGLARTADDLRTVARMVWFGWVTLAGLVIGGTALVVVVRIAWAVLGWAVAR